MSRRIIRQVNFFVFIGFLSLPLHGNVVFDALDLGSKDNLLFRASSGGDGALVQNSLFLADLRTNTLRELTSFPERMDILEGGRTVQIRNAFGALRIPVSGGLPRSIPGFPSFSNGAPALGGRVEELAPSTDGKWLLYVEPVSAAYGNLVLIDAVTGERKLISSDVERPGQVFPACWSPDSRVFVYVKDGHLYYQSISSLSSISVDERYRQIGEGRINSVFWGGMGDFFYLKGSTVYRVRSSELFARALYADFLEIGQPAGKIPFAFDYNFDEFWVSPDSRSLLLSVGGRNLFYFPLGIDDYYGDFQSSLPYLMLPRSSSKIRVLWAPSGVATIIVSMPRNPDKKNLAYRLDTSNSMGVQAFKELETIEGAEAAISPDGTKALVWGEDGLTVYDYINWKALSSYSRTPVLSAAWLGNESYIVGDASRIERIDSAGRRSMVGISSANATFGYDEKSGRIALKLVDTWYTTDGQAFWSVAGDVKLRATSLASERYRVYLEKQSSGPYDNLPMIRNVAGVGTQALLIKNDTIYEPFPEEEEGLDSDGVFNHGNRTGIREIALTFDLMDDADGLPLVLDILDRFNLRVTFFMNGEFLRRHATAAKEIADAGHEAASLFFAPIDLSDGRYRIDDDFIHRGLARNEDEYYQATGHELSLLWHPPYYAASSEISAAAAAVGYRTIGRDVDPLDWVGHTQNKSLSLPIRSASDIVNDIMARKKPGSIVPIRLGLPTGGRDDYLFMRLDVLLDALIRAGYTVVTASNLAEHAR